MKDVNKGRLMAGGALAALVMIVGELGIEPLMAPDVDGWLRSLGVTPPGEEAAVAVVLLAFVVGVITVHLYASIAPRYGFRPATALRAGAIVWALSCAIPNVFMVVYGIMPFGKLFWFATIWPLVESLAAAWVGTRVYREDPAEPRAQFAHA